MAGTSTVNNSLRKSSEKYVLVDFKTYAHDTSNVYAFYLTNSSTPIQATTCLQSPQVANYTPLVANFDGPNYGVNPDDSFSKKNNMTLRIANGFVGGTITGNNAIGSIIRMMDFYSGSTIAVVRLFDGVTDSGSLGTIFYGQVESIENVSRNGFDCVLTEFYAPDVQYIKKVRNVTRYTGGGTATYYMNPAIRDKYFPRSLGSTYAHDGSGNPLFPPYGKAATAYCIQGNDTYTGIIYNNVTAVPALHINTYGKNLYRYFAQPYVNGRTGTFDPDMVFIWGNDAWSIIGSTQYTLINGVDGTDATSGNQTRDVQFKYDHNITCRTWVPMSGIERVHGTLGTLIGSLGQIQPDCARMLDGDHNTYFDLVPGATGTGYLVFMGPQNLNSFGSVQQFSFLVDCEQTVAGVPGTVFLGLGTYGQWLTGASGKGISYNNRTVISMGWTPDVGSLSPDWPVLWGNDSGVKNQWQFVWNDPGRGGSQTPVEFTLLTTGSAGTLRVYNVFLQITYLLNPVEIIRVATGRNLWSSNVQPIEVQGDSVERDSKNRILWNKPSNDIRGWTAHRGPWLSSADAPDIFMTIGGTSVIQCGTDYSCPMNVIYQIFADSNHPMNQFVSGPGTFGAWQDAASALNNTYNGGSTFYSYFCAHDSSSETLYNAARDYANQFLITLERGKDNLIRAFTYNPYTPSASRFWRNSRGTFFTLDNISDVKYSLSSSRLTFNRFDVHHRMNLASGNLESVASVDKDNDLGLSNSFTSYLAGASRLYTAKQRCALSGSRYGIDKLHTFEAPSILRVSDAAVIRDNLVAKLWAPSIQVTFTTYEDIFDLEPMHLIQFGSDFDTELPFMLQDTNNTWANRTFEVQEVTLTDWKRGAWRVRVVEYAPHG